jgi:sialate O-acetylesterase
MSLFRGWGILLCLPGGVYGQKKIMLAAGLQSNMVIQQNKPFTVWGKAGAGSVVTIWADWMDAGVEVHADSQGNFLGMIPVPRVRPGDYSKHRLTVSSGDEKPVLDNVLIGEVWFCSGQSNMQFSMKEVLDSTAEIAAADHPNIRLFNAGLNFSATPLDSIKGRWEECSPKTVRSFSAVGYFFGRMLQQRLDVPVGLIFSGIGASAAQAYVPQPVLAADTQLNRAYLLPYLSSPKSKEKINGGFTFEKVTRPFLLYNAMIHPFRHYSVRGICWYQGESNRMERGSYTRLVQAMIGSWRSAFSQGELPFYYVQIAPFFYDKEDPVLADEAFFREAQEHISTLGNTAMVVTMDVGEAKNLHPKNKKPIGLRLARTALNRVYGDLSMAYQGPVFRNMEIHGREAVIYFQDSTLAGGLTTNDGKAPAFFTAAGSDHVFYPATAVIEGQRIVVRCAEVRRPMAVRYAFTNYPVTNLQNGEGLPAVPFRTDNWAEQGEGHISE